MELNLEIGSYRLYRRTDYSKLCVLDKNGNNINDTIEGCKIAKKIISDYITQQTYKENFFNIQYTCDGYINLNRLINYSEKYDIENLFIPEEVTEISARALSNGYFKRVHLPKGLRIIREEAFKTCRNLKEIVIPDSKGLIMEAAIFIGCSALDNIVLPDSMEKIPRYMFNGCGSLKKIDMPHSLETIEEGSFYCCMCLENITLPDSLSIIESYAFAHCIELEKINIPKNLRDVGVLIFDCGKIDTLTINHNLPHPPKGSYQDALNHLNINKIEIAHDVQFIDCHLFKKIAKNVKQINFLGNEDEFNIFAKKSKDFLKIFNYAKINIEKKIDDKTKIEKDKNIINDTILEK